MDQQEQAYTFARDMLERLSARELQVFDLIAIGRQPSQIASQLCLSVKTIGTYRARILEKLEIKSNAEIATLRAQNRLAAAEDHALLAEALCAKVARWEPFDTGEKGEICVGGMRYCVGLDSYGVPALYPALRAVLVVALDPIRKARLS